MFAERSRSRLKGLSAGTSRLPLHALWRRARAGSAEEAIRVGIGPVYVPGLARERALAHVRMFVMLLNGLAAETAPAARPAFKAMRRPVTISRMAAHPPDHHLLVFVAPNEVDPHAAIR